MFLLFYASFFLPALIDYVSTTAFYFIFVKMFESVFHKHVKYFSHMKALEICVLVCETNIKKYLKKKKILPWIFRGHTAHEMFSYFIEFCMFVQKKMVSSKIWIFIVVLEFVLTDLSFIVFFIMLIKSRNPAFLVHFEKNAIILRQLHSTTTKKLSIEPNISAFFKWVSQKCHNCAPFAIQQQTERIFSIFLSTNSV